MFHLEILSSGIEIKGRKLRLRWGENAPTTPEVDEFHRAPERFKTRPCYEVYKNLTCPRGHKFAELRKFVSGCCCFYKSWKMLIFVQSGDLLCQDWKESASVFHLYLGNPANGL